MATEAQFYAFCLLLFPFSLIHFPFCEAGISTTVENSLQISHFIQNKPNFRNAQINVTSFYTVDYENKTLSRRSKNKPNSNPIKANSKPIKANIKPKQSQYKPKQTQFQKQKNAPKNEPSGPTLRLTG
jgi:hypothetical protein